MIAACSFPFDGSAEYCSTSLGVPLLALIGCLSTRIPTYTQQWMFLDSSFVAASYRGFFSVCVWVFRAQSIFGGCSVRKLVTYGSGRTRVHVLTELATFFRYFLWLEDFIFLRRKIFANALTDGDVVTSAQTDWMFHSAFVKKEEGEKTDAPVFSRHGLPLVNVFFYDSTVLLDKADHYTKANRKKIR